MLILIFALTFSTVALLILGMAMKTEREIVVERMQQHSDSEQRPAIGLELELQRPVGERVVLPILSKLATIGRYFTPAGASQAVEEKLDAAGRPWGLGAKEFFGLRVLSIGTLTVVAVVAFKSAGGISPLLRVLLPLLIIVIGILLPDYMLQRATRTRQSKIRKVMADTIDLLSVSMEAGLGLDGAMARVVEKLKSPLSDEMRRALHEMRIGKLRTEALRAMAKRMRVHEFTSFVAAVCQADQLGVSIAKVLKVQGDTLRTTRSQKAREAAAKLPVTMLFPLVLFIFPAVFVVLLGPAAIRVYRYVIAPIAGR